MADDEEVDPRHRHVLDLTAEVMARSISGDIEGAQRAQEELEEAQMDELPPPGKFKIVVGKPHESAEFFTKCTRCDKVLTAGGGILFVEMTKEEEAELAQACHWADSCPAWKSRWFRLKWNERTPWRKFLYWRHTPKWARKKK